MIFVLNMAAREMRAAWRRLALFFLCIAVGVAAIVSVRSFTEQLTRSLARQSRVLVGGDVRLYRNRPWTPDSRAAVERALADAQVAIDYTETIETQTMVRAEAEEAPRPTRVELRAVQSRYPLYGHVQLEGGREYSHAMLADRGAIVSASLLERLGLHVGDRIRIGVVTFTIRAASERVPGSGLNFSPTPRVLIDYDQASAAGLLAFGSRAGYVWLFRTVEGQETRLTRSLGTESRRARAAMSIETYRYVENWLGRSFDNVDGFTGLVGLSILVLGGIGVASVTRLFVEQRLTTIAILKCLGGRNGPVLGAYLLQGLSLSLAGCLFGLLLAHVVTVVGVRQLEAFIPLDMQPGLTWRASALGVAVGLLIALLFSLPPLLEIRRIKPASILRQDTAGRRFDPVQLAARVLLTGMLIVVAIWQAGNYARVAVFIGGVAAAALVLHLAGVAIVRALRHVGHLPTFALRHGVGSLHRPGNQTAVILFAVGIGSLFLIAVRINQINVLREYRLDLGSLDVDMFLIDIQADQKAEVAATLARLDAPDVRLVPVVRARLVATERADGARAADPAVRRFLGGEWRLTYRDVLDPSERIVAGRFWDATSSADPEVSVEEEVAGWLQLDVGDVAIFDLLGRRIRATVTSLRRIDRGSRSLGWLTRFDFVFRPGALEAAPHTFIGALKGPAPGAPRARLQNQFVERFPNVMFIDALDDIAEIRRRLGALSLGVSVLGGFVYVCGVLILIGSIAMTKFQRLYEAAVMKTLGARKSVVVNVALVEYGVLGLLAGLIGSAGSIGVTWAMSAYGGLRIPWHPQPAVNLIGIVSTAVLVTLVGVLASWDVLVKKPLGTLREH